MFRNQDEKLLFIGTCTALLGIDIAKKTHYGQFIHPNGIQIGKPLQIHNTKESFECLLGRLEKIKQEYGYKQIVIGLESTGHYWKPLMSFLASHNYLVVLVNPYHVKQSKELDDNAPSKFDPKDAGIIAKLVKDGRFFEIYTPQGAFNELRVLNNTRTQFLAKLNGVKNVLTATLDEYFPEFQNVFKDFTGKAASHILYNCPFPKDLVSLGVEGIVAEFKEAVKKGLGRKRAEKLYQMACVSIGVQANEAARLKLRLCLDEYFFLTSRIEQIEKMLEQQLMATGLGEYILSIKGVGVITAAGFIAEIGDPSRFTCWKQVRKLAGYNLVAESSGQKKGKMTISKRGRSELRSVLYKIALGLITCNQQFKSLYHHLKTRSQNPLKGKQALVAIAMKFLKVFFALVKNHVKYDPTIVIEGGREKQPKAA